MRVGIQGQIGSYSHKAALSIYGQEVETVSYDTFKKAGQGLLGKEVDAIVLPIENSIIGSITENYDLLHEQPFFVESEKKIRVNHCLLSNETSIDTIYEIRSHPKALQQCDGFLQGLNRVRIIPSLDTAGEAKNIAENHIKNVGVIASAYAGLTYGLKILKKNIADHSENYTRFWAVVLPKQKALFLKGKKVVLSCVLEHEKGALVKALQYLDQLGCNLTKIESRPIMEEPFVYRFFIEMELEQTLERFDSILGAVQTDFLGVFS